MSALAAVGRALARGASPRLLGMFVVALALPALLATLPWRSFFASHLGHVPGAKPSLDSFTLVQLVMQAGEPEAARSMGQGLAGAVLVALVLAPFLAGAAAAEARAEAPLGLRELLAGGAEYYGRMVRMTFVAVLPFALAGIVAAVAAKLAKSTVQAAVLESSADRAGHLRDLVMFFAFWVAHVTVEAGRAHLAAEPDRRSAFFAWWSGVRLLVRHPVRAFGIAAITGLAGAVVATLLVAVRLRIGQGTGAGIGFAFVVGQIAVAALGWGRVSGIVGLTQLIRRPTPLPI